VQLLEVGADHVVILERNDMDVESVRVARLVRGACSA
jgi:hypothetical protein